MDAIAEMCDMPGTCVFSSSSDESDCDSDQSEEGPTYSILTDNEVCDFDDISVGSQDDAPELAIDESLCSPFTNEEFETVLISTDPICSNTTTRGDETVLISADLIFSSTTTTRGDETVLISTDPICSSTTTRGDETVLISTDLVFSSTTTTRGDETVLISTDHICSSATTRDDETALISTDPICTATRNEETISRDPTNDDTVLIFGVPDAATVDERTVNPINNYKLMGDNIDISIKSRYMRAGAHLHNQSLHYFQFLAVRDRIDFSELETVPKQLCHNNSSKIAKELLPNTNTDHTLLSDFSVIVSHILAANIPFFKFAVADVATWHKDHKHYEEMSLKSEVVSSIIIVYNYAIVCKYVHVELSLEKAAKNEKKWNSGDNNSAKSRHVQFSSVIS